MSPPQRETPPREREAFKSDSTPTTRLESSGHADSLSSTPPATSNVEYAISALGDLLNLAFSDALRVDQLARQTIQAWENIDAEHRILLGDRHPGLVEALLLLENQYYRMDNR